MAHALVARKEMLFHVTKEQLWDALTDPLITREWMYGCEILSNFIVGSSVVWKGAEDGRVYAQGVVTQIEPHAFLAYTVFDPNAGIPDSPENYLQVTYTLQSVSGGTMITITQGDFSHVLNGEKRYQDSLSGWDYALNRLKVVIDRA